ncbi:MAG: RDD family protein [Actinomycetota bacterium]|nr:RDD family protein [Actinomycetota bacterium]
MRSDEPSPAGIVTPEAVVLEFELAGPASRGLALMLDLVVQAFGLSIALMPVSLLVAPLSETAAMVVLIVLTPVALFAYAPICEAAFGGRSVGKMAMGLRVVAADGSPVGLRRAAIRGVFVFVDLLLPPGGLTGLVSMLIGGRCQRIGDRVAATVVLRERSASPAPRPMVMAPPPGWEGYVAALDVSLLRTEQAALVRQLLLRVSELGEEARWETTRRLANHVANQIRHQPPPYLGAEAFLVAVLAAVQHRSAALAGVAIAGPPQGPPPGRVPAATGPRAPGDRVAAPAWAPSPGG